MHERVDAALGGQHRGDGLLDRGLVPDIHGHIAPPLRLAGRAARAIDAAAGARQTLATGLADARRAAGHQHDASPPGYAHGVATGSAKAARGDSRCAGRLMAGEQEQRHGNLSSDAAANSEPGGGDRSANEMNGCSRADGGCSPGSEPCFRQNAVARGPRRGQSSAQIDCDDPTVASRPGPKARLRTSQPPSPPGPDRRTGPTAQNKKRRGNANDFRGRLARRPSFIWGRSSLRTASAAPRRRWGRRGPAAAAPRSDRCRAA